MKKIYLLFLFSYIINSYAASFVDDKDLYKPDTQATAKAPWKVGEKVDGGYAGWNQDMYRKFIGINSQGEYLIQAFYASTNKPYTSVLRLKNKNDVVKPMTDFCAFSLEGLYIMYGPRSGEKIMEGNCHNGKQIGVWRAWDRTTGELKLERDFGSPPK